MSEWIKFMHFADTHCGYTGNGSRYGEYESLNIPAQTEDGIPVRQDDVDKTFKQAIDIAIDKNVDFVLHAGDGTDNWGYKRPYVFNQYSSQVSRLFPHNIPYVEIVGNHNLPSEPGMGCYLETLGKFPGVHTAFNGYEQIELPEFNVVVHCLPATSTHDQFKESLEQVKK